MRLADAQGLRLLPGGFIRVQMTLCAADDLFGEAFGAKVTPWQPVPSHEAPQWTPREALFRVPTERLFEATFRNIIRYK